MEDGDRQDRKPELTLDQAVKTMQAAWTKRLTGNELSDFREL
jgi:hypothetical protein